MKVGSLLSPTNERERRTQLECSCDHLATRLQEHAAKLRSYKASRCTISLRQLSESLYVPYSTILYHIKKLRSIDPEINLYLDNIGTGQVNKLTEGQLKFLTLYITMRRKSRYSKNTEECIQWFLSTYSWRNYV